MFIVRLFHAGWSLLAVHFTFKITEILSDKRIAGITSILFALHWVVPFLSMRNLIEIVAITPMLGAIFYMLRSDKLPSMFIAGLFFGLSFVFRYHTALIATGACLAFLIDKKIVKVAVVFFSFVVFVSAVQGTIDYLAWGYPFAAAESYFLYNGNMDNAKTYTVGAWYQYLVLLIGLFIPPFSFGLFGGLFTKIKKHLIIFLPLILFLAFHSWYPNKQERFVSTILPLFIISGVIGWEFLKEKVKISPKLIRGVVIFYWVINSLLLIIFSTTYGKKSRAESLYFVGKQENVQGVIVDTGIHDMVSQPTFYLNKDVPILMKLRKERDRKYDLADTLSKISSKPNFHIFYGEDDLQTRVSEIEILTKSKIEHIETIEPSLIDNILYTLNPKNNKNQKALIYKSK
jgi:hypothetical protein